MNKKILSVLGALVILATLNTSRASTVYTTYKKGISNLFIANNIYTNSIADDEVITIKVVPGEMRFDKTKFSVRAGSTVKIIVDNPDFMQHNLLILKPGSLDKVGNAADALAGMANGAELQYIPKMPEVLYSTPLLDQGEKHEIIVKVPSTEGDYPFVCTFPGHWRMMSGVMTVVK